MTISSTNRKAGPYAGNDVATAFPFSFKVFSANDLYVVRADATGAETVLTLTANYTVALNADQDANPGGTVNLLVALVSGNTLTITSSLEYLQPTDLTNNGGFYPKVISGALDRLTIFVQQLAESVSRSLKTAISTPPGVQSQLPSPVPYALIGWNAAGDGFQNTDPTYSTALSTDLASASGASLVGFIQSGTGAVKQTVEDVLRERVSVKDFCAVGDGVADDQVGLVDAVAHCFASGNWLFWPDGTYVSTASIPNFHEVRHVGPGAVKRGADLFYVEPRGSQANALYLATTGDAANDGLSASQPMLTFQNTFDVLKNYGPMLDGNWSIVGAAGTVTISGGSHNHTTPSKNRVVIRGPAAGHPNVPTLLVDGGGNQASYRHGINCDGPGVRVEVRDIKFQNFTEVSGSTRVGLLAANGADLYTQNVHGLSCSWSAVMAKECEASRLSGGILDANSVGSFGFISDSTRTSFGYGSASTSDGPIVKNALSAGVYWSTGSQGHCDYVTFEDNAIGFLCAENSRCDTVGNDYKRNNVGKRAISGGVMGTVGAAETFNDGTADANNTNVEYKAYSGNSVELTVEGSGSWLRVAFDRLTRALSGTTPTTLTTPYTIKAKRLQGVGKSCKIHVYGVWTALTAGSTITINFGGMALTFTVPGAATNVAFEIEATLHDVASGYRAFGRLTQGLSQVRHAAATAGFDSASDQAISVAVTMAGASDAVNLYRTDVYLMG